MCESNKYENSTSKKMLTKFQKIRTGENAQSAWNV